MIRKLQFLKTAALSVFLLGGANLAWAQSTYSWDASKWENDNRGEVTVDGTSLKVNKVKKHLVGIKTKSGESFKLPRRQTWMIVTGTGFVANEKSQNDPNVKINGNANGIRVKDTTTDTKLVFDITSQLPTETDFFGNAEITEIKLIVKTSAGSGTGEEEEEVSSNNPTITSISFYQPDMIDACSSSQVKVRRQSDSWESENNNFTLNTNDNKNTLAFTPLADGKEFRFYLNPSAYNIHSGAIYMVIEADANINDGTRKLEYLTLKGSNTGSSASIVDGWSKTLTNGHKIFIFNPGFTFENTRNAYLENNNLNCTKLGFILKSSGTNELNIYRIGLYSIREIEDLYSTDIPYYKFTFTNAFQTYVGDKQSGTQKTVDINTTDVTSATLALQLKSIGDYNIGNSEIDLRDVTVKSGDPLLVDLPALYSNTNLRVLLSTSNYIYFPTKVNRVRLKDCYYENYVDGSITPIENKWNNDSKTYYYLHTREFKEKYNSCCLPFATNTENLPSSLKAYTFSSATDGGEVTFTKANGAIAANTPFIIKADTTGYYLIPASATGTAAITTPSSYYATAASNDIQFVGSFVNKEPDGDYASSTNYGISTDGTKFLKMAADTKTTYYRAFIADKRIILSRALSISFDEGDGTTAIVSPEAVDGLTTKSVYYDLQGRRVANPSKGLYIVNGKKVIIK